MLERIPNIPPVIPPVTKCTYRPLWSVMIPVYNCIEFLGETLQSVLIQDSGEAIMQIEVVDDCSTDGNVAALVKAVGKGRINYFRQEHNRGSLRNFETCLNRSKGKWVHLLHGDDRVEPGFYQEIQSMFNSYPQIGAAFTNFFYIDGKSKILNTSNPLLNKTNIIKDFLFKIAHHQMVQPPAIVVKRSVYEALGSFYAVHYGEDWEMWARIAAHYPVAHSPKPLASYRTLINSNITHQSFLNGQNVADIIKVIDIIQNYLPLEKRKKLKNKALKFFSIHYTAVASQLFTKDKKTAFLQAQLSWKMHRNIMSFYYILKLYSKRLIGIKVNYKHFRRSYES